MGKKAVISEKAKLEVLFERLNKKAEFCIESAWKIGGLTVALCAGNGEKDLQLIIRGIDSEKAVELLSTFGIFGALEEKNEEDKADVEEDDDLVLDDSDNDCEISAEAIEAIEKANTLKCVADILIKDLNILDAATLIVVINQIKDAGIGPLSRVTKKEIKTVAKSLFGSK